MTACQDAPVDPATVVPEAAQHALGKGRSASTPARVQQELARLRQATAAYHDIERARDAGYEVLVTHPETGAECLAHETDGGMGYHYLKPDLVSDHVAVDQPEVLIYERGPNGKLRLVAVEYIIPFDLRGENESPPVLFGQEFVHNHTFDLWALHVWVWKQNPSGMFADYNPRVSCDA